MCVLVWEIVMMMTMGANPGGGGGDGGTCPPRFFRWGTQYQMSPPPPPRFGGRMNIGIFFFFFFFFWLVRNVRDVGWVYTPTHFDLPDFRRRWRSGKKVSESPPPAHSAFLGLALPLGLAAVGKMCLSPPPPPQSASDLRPWWWWMKAWKSRLLKNSTWVNKKEKNREIWKRNVRGGWGAAWFLNDFNLIKASILKLKTPALTRVENAV